MASQNRQLKLCTICKLIRHDQVSKEVINSFLRFKLINVSSSNYLLIPKQSSVGPDIQANSKSCKERKGEMSGVQEDAGVSTEEPVCICGGPETLSERKKRRKKPKSTGKALDKDTPQQTHTHIHTCIHT